MEPLKDPCNDRVVKSLPPPPVGPLKESILFPHSGIASSE